MEKIGEDFLHSSISMRFIFYGMVWITQNPVGVDAHIDPAGCTGFTEIFGETEPSHWADRAVGPYGEISMHSYPVGADDSVRPQDISVLRKSSAKPQLPSGPM